MKELNNVMNVQQWRKFAASKVAKPVPKDRTLEPYKDRSKYTVVVGIDPGTNTGVCFYSDGYIKIVETMPIHKALPLVQEWIEYYRVKTVLVRFEDARLRTWYGSDKNGEKKKGAGSVERDCSIWQDFLEDIGVDYERVHPKHVKASTAKDFAARTGYTGRTSIHAREAASMVI